MPERHLELDFGEVPCAFSSAKNGGGTKVESWSSRWPGLGGGTGAAGAEPSLLVEHCVCCGRTMLMVPSRGGDCNDESSSFLLMTGGVDVGGGGSDSKLRLLL